MIGVLGLAKLHMHLQDKALVHDWKTNRKMENETIFFFFWKKKIKIKK